MGGDVSGRQATDTLQHSNNDVNTLPQLCPCEVTVLVGPGVSLDDGV